MDELVRRALLGERLAQKECNLRGIMLPCPKCYGDVCIQDFESRVDFCTVTFKCLKCGLEYTATQWKIWSNTASAKLNPDPLEQWNDRPLAPIGRCNDCTTKEKATVNAKGFLICPVSGMEITDDDFCSYFEQEEKE